jgi:hypothetical protein
VEPKGFAKLRNVSFDTSDVFNVGLKVRPLFILTGFSTGSTTLSKSKVSVGTIKK